MIQNSKSEGKTIETWRVSGFTFMDFTSNCPCPRARTKKMNNFRSNIYRKKMTKFNLTFFLNWYKTQNMSKIFKKENK